MFRFQITMSNFFDWPPGFTVIALGATLFGAVCGALGSLAVLKKQSLLGDAMAHATLPGLVLLFLITHQKSLLILMGGAAATALIAAAVILILTNSLRFKQDTALGVVLSTFFGFGVVLLSLAQQKPLAAQAGLNKFLFGNAATLLWQDVVLTAVLGVAAIVVFWILQKDIIAVLFDPDYAATLGVRALAIEAVVIGFLVVAILSGLQTSGVVLVSAMVIAPAAAARQWTNAFYPLVSLSGLFGSVAGFLGSWVSVHQPRLSTGPLIAVCLVGWVLLSMLIGPQRGTVMLWLKSRRRRERVRFALMLEALLEIQRAHSPQHRPHEQAVLRTIGGRRTHEWLTRMQQLGWVQEGPPAHWSLTSKGVRGAERFIRRMTESLQNI